MRIYNMEIGNKVIITDGAYKDKIGIIKEFREGVAPFGADANVKFDWYMVEVTNEDGSIVILPHPIEKLKIYE